MSEQHEIIIHTIAPVYDHASRVLLLGTAPSPKSRELGFFYGHPQNRFWRVLSALFGEPIGETAEEKRAFLLKKRIALWDVLHSCEIIGAADASIRNPVPNDLSLVFHTADIRAVFATGKKAAELYTRHCVTGFNTRLITALPSTSPANAQYRLEDLIAAYRVILPFLT